MAGDDIDDGLDDEEFDKPDPKSKLTEGNKNDKTFGRDDEDDDLEDLEVVIADPKSEKNDKPDDRGNHRDGQGKFKSRSEEDRLGKRRNKGGPGESRKVRELEDQLNQERMARGKLEERINAVESDTTRIDQTNIDSQLGEAQRYLDTAKSAHAQAIKDGDGDKAAEALDLMMEAKEALTLLKEQKKQRRDHTDKDDGRADARRDDAAKPRKADPVVLRQFDRWHQDNDWFDPGLRDQDSRIALHVDTTMKAEGWDPRTPEYWDELDVRLRQNPTLARKVFSSDDNEEDDDMPARSRRNEDDSRRRDDGDSRRDKPLNSRTQQSSGNRKKIVVSRERADAMKEMGLQPGTSEWKKMAKKYESYDKQRTAAQGR